MSLAQKGPTGNNLTGNPSYKKGYTCILTKPAAWAILNETLKRVSRKYQPRISVSMTVIKTQKNTGGITYDRKI